MKNDFFKFPSTPHLAMLADVEVRNDKVLSEAEQNDFLNIKLLLKKRWMVQIWEYRSILKLLFVCKTEAHA